jgi:hypothetical protein
LNFVVCVGIGTTLKEFGSSGFSHPTFSLAINAVVAVSSLNYHRFFKLFQTATESQDETLQLLMEKLAAQMRKTALHQMIKAYVFISYPMSCIALNRLLCSATALPLLYHMYKAN